MTPVVVAWCVQLVWEVTRCVLGSYQVSNVALAISTAVMLATTLVLALGFAGIARRHTGVRRNGALLACGAYVVMLGVFVVRDVLLQTHASSAIEFARMLRNGGWSLLEAVAIIGLAMASGGRGRWLAPFAIGLTFFALAPGAVFVSPTPVVAVVFRILAVLICMALANDLRRAMPAHEPRPAAAARGALLAERVCWFFAVINLASLVVGDALTIGPDLAVAISNIVGETTFIVAVWWIAGAGIARLPQWPQFASAVLALCWLMRTARNWLHTIIAHWGALDQVPLHMPHWAFSVPVALSALLGLIAYGVYARRTHRGAVLVHVAFAIAFQLAHVALWIVGAGHPPVEATLLAANIATAMVFRSLRPAFQAEVPAQMPAARLV